MEDVRRLPEAVLRERPVAVYDLQSHENEPVPSLELESRQREYSGRRSLSRLLPFSQVDLPLPVDPEAPRSTTREYTLCNRQVTGSVGSTTHPPKHTSPQDDGGSARTEWKNDGSQGKPTLRSLKITHTACFSTESERHKKRKEALTEELKPLLADHVNASVLLCWGDRNSCSVLPVHVSNDADEEATWQELQQAWYTARGHWRKCLPGFNITRVEVVQLSILGSMSNLTVKRGRGEYTGMYQESNNEAEKTRLEGIVDSFNPSGFMCSKNTNSGIVPCDERCVSWTDPPVTQCPEDKYWDAKRDLSRLHTRHLMKLVFTNPGLARMNDFLEQESIVYGHIDVLEQLNKWHDSELRELNFRGLLIEERWTINTHQIVLPSIATLLIAVVIAAKFIFDWDIAWSVGCFFVSLISLLWMRATYMAG